MLDNRGRKQPGWCEAHAGAFHEINDVHVLIYFHLLKIRIVHWNLQGDLVARSRPGKNLSPDYQVKLLPV